MVSWGKLWSLERHQILSLRCCIESDVFLCLSLHVGWHMLLEMSCNVFDCNWIMCSLCEINSINHIHIILGINCSVNILFYETSVNVHYPVTSISLCNFLSFFTTSRLWLIAIQSGSLFTNDRTLIFSLTLLVFSFFFLQYYIAF